jgi:GNAT superfamily N-acetyltransferase
MTTRNTEFEYRLALPEDIPAIEVLMQLSINGLLKPYLTERQLEASIESMGLDEQLIKDQTYFIVNKDNIFVGCGGWSNRKTLFGANHTPNRDDSFLNPEVDAARIRAMYTHPDWARMGIGTLIMNVGEKEAKKMGFTKCELMATQAGVSLYKNHGYIAKEEINYESASGASVSMTRMEKHLK